MLYPGHTFTDSNGSWRIIDLLELARKHGQIEHIPIKDLYKSYVKTKTDERKGSPEFVQRAMEADLRYPILVADGPRNLQILDGIHRYWKARHKGFTKIRARVLPYSVLYSLSQMGAALDPIRHTLHDVFAPVRDKLSKKGIHRGDQPPPEVLLMLFADSLSPSKVNQWVHRYSNSNF